VDNDLSDGCDGWAREVHGLVFGEIDGDSAADSKGTGVGIASVLVKDTDMIGKIV